MGARKKGASSGSKDSEELGSLPLQAILLADSFTTEFQPMTLERPNVLLPVANVPMINYTLGWLESAGVKEVFVFCCDHSNQVINYLESSGWLHSQPNFRVTTVESHDSVGAGDALRLIYERNVIHGDFVLISGDIVTNMSLTHVLQKHKERRKKDSNAVMTIVIKRSKPNSQITTDLQSRLGNGEVFMAIDPNTKQLLYYEDNRKDHAKGSHKLLLADKHDCYIDICSPEVLSLFADNFDYQHLRRDFLKGLLVDDIMGYKIFTHEIQSSYAARIDNFRSYDTISKDIIHRGTSPTKKLERQGMYRASGIWHSSSAQIGPFTVIGNGTNIGDNTKISNSIIGKKCCIGSNVSIEDSYIWDNVTIEDGCKLRHAIICDGVYLKSGAVLEPGVVLSFNVVIGQQFIVPPYSKVSLLKQPIKLDSYEGLEQETHCSELDAGGAGYVWSVCDEEWRHSVAPIPEDKLAEAISIKAVEEQDDSEGFSGDECGDDSDFENEVEATFLRAVHENIKVEHVILEVSCLKLSYNKQAADCVGALFYSIMKLALGTAHNSASELLAATKNTISKWKGVLKPYLRDIDEEIEVILKFEDICLESAKEFSSVFDLVLFELYEQDIISEGAILTWEDEKQNADEADRVFVKQSEKLIQWLKEADEEEDEEE